MFVCAGCERTLRKQLAEHKDVIGGQSVALPANHHGFEMPGKQLDYTTTFPRGRRGGAIIDFGRAVVLEVFLPFVDDTTGEILPFCPMPLVGDIVHDIGRKKEIDPRELDACQRGACCCDGRPTGWRITPAIARALLGCTESYLYDRGSQWPGRIPGWQLSWDTVTFMREAYFNPEFVLPTREESRAALAARTRARSGGGCTHERSAPARRRRGR